MSVQDRIRHQRLVLKRLAVGYSNFVSYIDHNLFILTTPLIVSLLSILRVQNIYPVRRVQVITDLHVFILLFIENITDID